MRQPYRIAVAGPGGLGKCAIREIQRLPELELVGVLAYAESKNGVDAGELAGIGKQGIKATTDFESFKNESAECVIFTARDFGDFRSDEQILGLLRAGKNVITPLPYHYLKVRGPEVETRFQAAAKEGNATLHGAGITPGFFNERLAMLLTNLSNDVTHIHMQELFNAEDLAGGRQTLEMLGFGISKEAAAKNTSVAMFAENYLVQPIWYVADQLGIKIDRIERADQLVTAPVDIHTPAMEIKKGTVGCVSYAWTAFAGGKPFYTTEVFWYVGTPMRPSVAVGDDCWTVTVEGRPSIRVTVESKASFAKNLKMLEGEPTPPGYHTTVVVMLQAIPFVIGAPAGLLLPAMPEVHWKQDMRT